MNKNFTAIVATFIFSCLTGCAATPSQPTLQQMYGVGVSTQSRVVETYTVAVPTNQQRKIIPYTYVGQPNVVHYMDITNMPSTQNYSIPAPPIVQNNYPQNSYYNNSTYRGNSYVYGSNSYNRNTTTYTVDQYGNRVVTNNYNTSNYSNSVNYSQMNNAPVAYVAPTTQAPSYGYEWRYNSRYGWGWYHPQAGWYLGWH